MAHDFGGDAVPDVRRPPTAGRRSEAANGSGTREAAAAGAGAARATRRAATVAQKERRARPADQEARGEGAQSRKGEFSCGFHFISHSFPRRFELRPVSKKSTL